MAYVSRTYVCECELERVPELGIDVVRVLSDRCPVHILQHEIGKHQPLVIGVDPKTRQPFFKVASACGTTDSDHVRFADGTDLVSVV